MGEDSAGRRTVKSEQAGLLWHILSATSRRVLGRYLSRAEIHSLNESYQAYKHRPKIERKNIELALLRDTRRTHGKLPVTLFALMTLLSLIYFLSHLYMIPSMGSMLRMTLFSALFLGTISPLALHLLPAYRLISLFRIRIDTGDAAYIFFALFGLVWTLFFIGLEHNFSSSRPRGISLQILCIGAVTAPLLEEIFFREFIPGLFGRDPNFAGHLIANCFFALAHIPTTFGLFAAYLVAGLFLSSVRIKTGGLLYAYLIHALSNLMFQLYF